MSQHESIHCANAHNRPAIALKKHHNIQNGRESQLNCLGQCNLVRLSTGLTFHLKSELCRAGLHTKRKVNVDGSLLTKDYGDVWCSDANEFMLKLEQRFDIKGDSFAPWAKATIVVIHYRLRIQLCLKNVTYLHS